MGPDVAAGGSRRIRSRADYLEFLRRDAQAHGLGRVTPAALLTRPALRFQRVLRRAEWLTNTARGPVSRTVAAAARLQAHRRGSRLGITVPINVAGPGLCLAHVGTIVISRKALIGADCRIHAGINVGEGRGGAPSVGDRCYLGPGSVLVGGITLGPGCVVGANAVVTRDFPARTVLAGVPARALRTADTDWPTVRE